MDDPQAPPAGTFGTVLGVDDTGSVMVHWDNGSGLNVVYGKDICRLRSSLPLAAIRLWRLLRASGVKLSAGT